jgi:predicted transcriptional regulator
LKAVKDKKPASVYELARIVNRDIKNVLQAEAERGQGVK